MQKNVLAGKIYVISAPEECVVTQTRNEQEFTLAEIPAAGGQKTITTIDTLLILSSDNAIISGPFDSTPALGGNSDGGNVESNLNVGHAAADAVAAVCTLTLGDLATGGTLADSNGQSVELDAPHAYATGHVDIADATNAGSITFGGRDPIAFAARPAEKALGFINNTGGRPDTDIGLYINGVHIIGSEDGGDLPSEWAGFINAADCGVDAEVDSENEHIINLTAQVAGAAGNDITLKVGEGVSWSAYEASGPTLTDGRNARSPQDVVRILNENEDCPAVAVLDEDEQGITLTAKQYGVDYELSEDGTLFSNPQDMTGSHGDYTIAELLEAIEDEFTDITAAAGTAEGTITLTANTAGKAANAITYTATGCFGSGTTRQGSTTRGKDAVEQTEYKIFLNGNEFTGGSAPVAPTPEPLGTTTTLKHGHVYTLAVAADTDLSALGVELNATAELWIDYTAGSVTWPTGLWWVEGSAPTLTAGKSYAIALRNDGVKLRANVQYEDTTPAQS